MDRTLWYAGQVPLDTMLLQGEKDAMVGVGWAMQGILGTGSAGTPVLVTDLTVVPSTPAGLSVQVTPGQVFVLNVTDSTAFSTLPADTHNIIKQGILQDAVTLAITPPGANSQVFLIQAAFSEQDAGSIVLPYMNPNDPDIAWSGPNGSGTPNFTRRLGKMLVTAKPGIAGASPAAPAPDAGYVGLYTVTVASGATTITAGNIAKLDAAPMLASMGQLPLIPRGVQENTWEYTGTTGGTNNAQTGKVLPVPPAYVAGQEFLLKVGISNTGATTININGLGVKQIRRADGSQLSAGDMPAGGLVRIAYDGTNFQLISWTGVLGSGGSGGAQIVDFGHFVIRPNINQVLTVGTFNKISLSGTFTTKTNLPNTSVASSSVTIGTNEGGLWLLNFNLITTAGAGPAEASVWRNNRWVTVQASSLDLGFGMNSNCVVLMRLVAGDVLDCRAYPTNSVTSLFYTYNNYDVTQFSGVRLAS